MKFSLYPNIALHILQESTLRMQDLVYNEYVKPFVYCYIYNIYLMKALLNQ